MTVAEKRHLIEPDHPTLSLSRQCELLDLNRSSYYYNAWEWGETALEIMRLIDEEYTRRPCKGKRQMCLFLKGQGYDIGVKRTRTLMRFMGLESMSPKPDLSKPHPDHPKFPYLLQGLLIDAPDMVWVSDITYIRLGRGFVYLVAAMDWRSRYVLAWELSTSLENDFCVRCLESALSLSVGRTRHPRIFNTDQGVQYTSRNFVKVLQDHGIQVSMDGKGRAFDNIMIERLWRTVKYEEVYLKSYDSVCDCRESLDEYIRYYNESRPHSSLRNKTPFQVYHEKKN